MNGSVTGLLPPVMNAAAREKTLFCECTVSSGTFARKVVEHTKPKGVSNGNG